MAATIETRPEVIPGLPPRRQSLGRTVVSWLTSTDHKVIGYLYLITAFLFFMFGGVLALLIRIGSSSQACSCSPRSSTTSSSRCTARS